MPGILVVGAVSYREREKKGGVGFYENSNCTVKSGKAQFSEE